MMPCPESFPVPLIHIAKADSTNGYLNALCEKEKVSELTSRLQAEDSAETVGNRKTEKT